LTPTDKQHVGQVTAPPAIVEETAADQVTVAPELMAVPPDAGVNEYVTAWFKRVRSGQSGVLPVVGGLIVIIIIFQIERSQFLTAGNLVNLLGHRRSSPDLPRPPRSALRRVRSFPGCGFLRSSSRSPASCSGRAS
jgi:hypothetical protein